MDGQGSSGVAVARPRANHSLWSVHAGHCRNNVHSNNIRAREESTSTLLLSMILYMYQRLRRERGVEGGANSFIEIKLKIETKTKKCIIYMY